MMFFLTVARNQVYSAFKFIKGLYFSAPVSWEMISLVIFRIESFSGKHYFVARYVCIKKIIILLFL